MMIMKSLKCNKMFLHLITIHMCWLIHFDMQFYEAVPVESRIHSAEKVPGYLYKFILSINYLLFGISKENE